MEFVRDRVSFGEIAFVMILSFFVGRINLFEGTFPAAIAFLVVMLSVSTVYIYLLPFLAGGILSYSGQGLFLYGDLAALAVLGLFFLFFHRKEFGNNSRIVIGGLSVVVCNLCVYGFADMLFMLRPELLAKELAVIFVYIRVFHVITKVIYGRKESNSVGLPRETIIAALNILMVSLIGSIGVYEVTFTLWVLAAALILYGSGLANGLFFWALSTVFSLCRGEMSWSVYVWVFAALTAAWFAMEMMEAKYRKPFLSMILFLACSQGGGLLTYSIAAAMIFLIWLPHTAIIGLLGRIAVWLDEETDTERDLEFLEMRKDLQKKREAFVSLGRLYGREVEGKQIVSYQFVGMARTIDRLLEQMQPKKTLTQQGEHLIKVSVGQASYSFDTVSGDSASAFPFDEDCLALVISDGMGKGGQAAEESNMVVKTLSGLLQAGFDVDLAMKTINGILMTGNEEERFATVDLAIIDRRKCRVKIYKMGAATTFIKHDGRVSMLKRQALPAGITSGLELEYIDIKLKKGDLLVMVSDGVTDCDRKDYNCDWLRARLLEMGSRDPETVAELVVNKATEKYGIRERDDLTVMTAVIGV